MMSHRTFPCLVARPCLLAVAAALLVAASTIYADDPIKPDATPTRGKEVLVIKESKNAQVFNAEDQDVTVNGNHNIVTIRGTCHALSISGDGNTVEVAAVASIALSGTGNEVAYGKAVDGEKPQVTDLGKTNKVTHVAAKAE